ncbi:carboxyl-terminal-processing protease [Heliomicrobium modesticaldum Ice1]|uniref:Carboxyl-terminal-processing protease n=1 Tax=Heliobacterium modesticaldum (strain ATCC 51547 / Ice1) TaxID=498761 RepID=B0TGX9_HELMI|nr:S41 family peptidase [Heliomicrobium modesticaldum]ABZ83304.1 carboxyl-terminal-processing protease [Heliomicrobium modesticaldum Ice1]
MAGRRSGPILFIVLVLLSSLLLTGSLAMAALGDAQNVGNLIKVVRLVTTEYLEPVSVNDLVNGAMKGMVAALKDPYSVYMEPKEYKHLTEQIEGAFTGIGVYINKKDTNQMVVVSPIKGGPAERAGLKSGDVIVKVNGEDVADMDVDVAVSKIKGPEGTEVNLTVFREASKSLLEFKINREKVNIPVVTAEIAKKDSHVGVLRISQFNMTASSEVDRAIQDFKDKKVKGIIMDLRDNPGGELRAAVNIASHFVPKGRVVSVVDREGRSENYETTREYINIPVVVLINGGSASASEIVAGAIKDSGTGALVGTKTFGKGVVQSLIELSGGAGVKLTTAKYLTPKGNDIHKIGIEPDVKVEAEKANGASAHGGEEADVQFDKGLETLRTMMR